MKLLGKRIIFEILEEKKEEQQPTILLTVKEEPTIEDIFVKGKVIAVGHEVDTKFKYIYVNKNHADRIWWEGKELRVILADTVIAYE